MKIIQNLVTPDQYTTKCPYAMTPAFYVVHNTDNDAPAANEIAYMKRRPEKISFHYAVDDKEVVQGILESRSAYHAGDGKYGDGNRCGIGVEICYSLSGGERFEKAEQNAAKFIAQGLYEKGWGIERVKRHYDFDGKNCPARTMTNGWSRFLDMVRVELDKLNIIEEDEEVKKFNTIAEVPDYGKATIQRLVDTGLLKGNENGLDLSEDMLRILVILERAKVI